jgi:hypothetical protein
MPLTAYPYSYAVATVGPSAYGTFDWSARIAHLITAGPKLHEFAMWPIAETAVIDLTTLAPFPITVIDALASGQADHRVYFATGDGHHLIVALNPSTLAEAFYNDIPGTLPQAGWLTVFDNAGTAYALCAGIGAGAVGALVYLLDMTSLAFVWQFNVAEHGVGAQPGNARVCRAPAGGYVVALSTVANDFVGVYRVDQLGETRLGSFTSAALDGSAAFTGFSVPGYDQADGNLIICFQTALGAYVCKLQLPSLALLWKISVHAMVDLGEAELKHGQLQLVSPGATPWDYYVIDTLAGSVSHVSEPVLANFNAGGAWSDTAQLLISQQNASPGPSNWATFGPPQPPATYQGGVIRRG